MSQQYFYKLRQMEFGTGLCGGVAVSAVASQQGVFDPRPGSDAHLSVRSLCSPRVSPGFLPPSKSPAIMLIS